tara:strand:- start:4351 stop:5454 length:1104 start_codon:yes stop_codon:yes gene_type:complete
MKHKVLDLFAGIGGFSLGLESTGGFETTAFCELDKKAQLVLKKHWPDTPIYEDIKELNYERLKADGTVPTVITGGFPCQDISCAGKGKGIKAERSGLWSEMFRLIRDVRPAWAIIENVSTLRSKGLTLVLQNLSSIGYMCEWHCIPASAVGAPHQRDRIWIVAHPSSKCDQPIIRETLFRWKASKASNTEPSCGSTRGNTLLSEVSNEEKPNNNVANPDNAGERTSECEDRPKNRQKDMLGREDNIQSEPSGFREDVADTVSSSERPTQGKHFGGGFIGRQIKNLSERNEVGSNPTNSRPYTGSEVWEGGYWAVEPNVGRVAHGIPNRVDRLKQLGNSVVPQIPYLLGCAILSTETLDAAGDTNGNS